MTFAHELQHFVQHSLSPKLWAENKLIPELPIAVTNASWGLQWSDIPVEREARAVAKRTAESLCGLEQVRDYVSRKINNSVKPSDLADWKFIQSLQTVTDLTDATRQVFQRLKRYRSELEQVLMQYKDDPDFADIELEALIG